MKKTKGSNDEFDEAYILVHKGGDSSSFPDGDGHTKTRFWLAGDVPPRNTSSDAFAVTEKRDKNGVHTLQYTVPADRLTQAVFDDLQQLQMSVRSGFQEIYAAIDSHINRHRIVITVNGKQQSSARNAHDNVVEALTRPYSTGQHIAAATSTVVAAVTTTVAALVTKATEGSEDVAVATTVSDTDVAAASPEYPAEVVARWALALAHPVAHLVPQDIIQLHAGGLPVTFQTTPQQPVRASPVRVDIRCGSFPAPYLTVQSRQSHYSSKPHSSPPAEGSLRRFAQINVSFEVHVVGPQRVSTAASPAPSSAGPLFETAAVVEFEVLPERTP